ncbi:MAG: TetR/AcrR family transcriptional regulator [Roseburia sp.]|nr:TetR/AcrR family transcriptional regulator [Roseburia sp.]
MKVRNLNNSSVKTRKLIKNTFIKMLAEKKEIGKITVSELTARAEISRATFYAHFDDIYGVVEAFENELIDKFFTHTKLLASNDYEKFFDIVFEYIRENDENYKMICASDDFLFSANRLMTLCINKLTELINADPNIKNREFIEIETRVFTEGLMCEFIRHCRGLNSLTLQDLRAYMTYWYKKFMKEHYL